MADGGNDAVTGGAGGDSAQSNLVRYNNPILVIKHPEKVTDLKVYIYTNPFHHTHTYGILKHII